MSTSSALDAFFQPKSIAVIGASADMTKMASRPITYLTKYGYRGEVFAPESVTLAGGRRYCSAEMPSTRKI